jgi:hypothetical protein
MMHEPILSRPDEASIEISSAICLFWDLESTSSALYQQMAERETNPVRAAAWRKLQDHRLILGHGRENHDVHLNQKLLWSCRGMIQFTQFDSLNLAEPLRVMAMIMQLKFLQVMLITSLRQQASITSMIDIETFSANVARVTDLVLTSRGC